jgi:subtilisin family serine protease
MMMKIFVFLSLLGFLFIPSHLFSQENYWVFFKDKAGVKFDPHSYFDKKTIERRKRQGIPLDQYTDRPVKESYLQELQTVKLDVKTTSRWLNAAFVETEPSMTEVISRFPFVRSVKNVRERIVQASDFSSEHIALSESEKDLMEGQIDRFGYESFKKAGIDGKGIRIAVLDAGFPNVDSSPFFKHLRENNQIKGTYDFIRDQEDVYGKSTHGTMVLSCIAGKDGDRQLGLATGAEFLLARTEYNFLEPFSEEENWFEAMEWADKNGADIISSSLGYTYKRYFKTDMDGETSLVSKAARIAASKGILVVVSMGNEGTSRWQVLGTPADTDSILSIGGLNPSTGIHTSFSSFGPTADMRLKPNLTAFGHVMAASKIGLIQTQGTSFSTPLVAGFAACAWQMNPEWDNMKLLKELCQSGDLYPYYDYAHGYGVPQFSYFLSQKKREHIKRLKYEIHDDYIKIRFKNLKGLKSYPYSYLFYHIAGPDGVLSEYAVVEPEPGGEFDIHFENEYSGYKLRIHFAGNTTEIIIP